MSGRKHLVGSVWPENLWLENFWPENLWPENFWPENFWPEYICLETDAFAESRGSPCGGLVWARTQIKDRCHDPASALQALV